MIEIKRYVASDKEAWDDFLDKSKIDSFLFKRDFMDYHSDRFSDHSLMVYRKGKLEAVLPGNISDKIFYSHQGLTYGGLVSSTKLMVKDVLEIFSKLNKTLKAEGVEEVIYKPTPHIYHKYPSEEDLYALFRLGADRIACNISSTIFQSSKIPFIESRKSGIRKAKRNGIVVTESNAYGDFWDILTHNLSERYGRGPVHTLLEITGLINKFPNNIKLYGAFLENKMLGGTLLFIMNSLVHIQYISANEIGKEIGALDLIFEKLINEAYVKYPIFDFGQSTEQNGHFLNEGLIFQKEGFGGRGITYESFKYRLT